ncbi:MAG: hypothetical protein HYV97_15985 [Bdellovibrio sp.]|nr:hypothetical protein [Bdellovibrio sp.]
MKIFLCGFMGAGKTYLMQSLKGRSMQTTACWDFIDLDERLFEQLRSPDDRHLGESIERIGWDKFRAMEKALIFEILNWKKNVIVSLGGGGLNHEVVEAIKKQADALLIWVDTPFQICLKRIQGDHTRPLAKKSERELHDLYLQRRSFYQQAHVRTQELDDVLNEQNPIDLERLIRKHVGSA